MQDILLFGTSYAVSPFLNQDKMYSRSNDVNSSSSSVEFKDSDSLSNASDDELENLFEMILQVFV